MAGSPHAEALGSAALDRVLTRARAALGVDRVALVLREDDALLLAAGRPGGEDVAAKVLEAERTVVVHEDYVAAGTPVHVEGAQRGALCVCSDDPQRRFDEGDLELLGELAGMAGDLLDRASARARVGSAVQAGVEALTGVLDLRDGLLARGADEVVALARRVADQLAQADPAVAEDVRALLKDRGIARPAPGRFARRTATPAGPPRQALSGAFDRLERMPALTEPRDRLLALLREERPPLSEIVATIESDLALVIAVLRAANLVAPKPGRGIAAVPEAIERLEPRGLEILVSRIPAVDFFQRSPASRTPAERFRLHAVAVQAAAARLADELGHENADELAVAALLHDVGKLVLVDAYPGYPERVHGGAGTPEERLRAERRELGIDHALVGGVLVRRWGLPGRLAAAIERHHAPDGEGTAAVLRLADLLAHYTHGRPIDPGALLHASRRVGLAPQALRRVMYELPGGGRRRAREPSPLTPKELEALRGLAEGKLYKEIAAALGVTTSTIRSHLHAAYRKMGASDRAQAVLIAAERGWL